MTAKEFLLAANYGETRHCYFLSRFVMLLPEMNFKEDLTTFLFDYLQLLFQW